MRDVIFDSIDYREKTMPNPKYAGNKLYAIRLYCLNSGRIVSTDGYRAGVADGRLLHVFEHQAACGSQGDRHGNENDTDVSLHSSSLYSCRAINDVISSEVKICLPARVPRIL